MKEVIPVNTGIRTVITRVTEIIVRAVKDHIAVTEAAITRVTEITARVLKGPMVTGKAVITGLIITGLSRVDLIIDGLKITDLITGVRKTIKTEGQSSCLSARNN